MNAWYGMILWGEATGDSGLARPGHLAVHDRDDGDQEYWFDVHGENSRRRITRPRSSRWSGAARGPTARGSSANPEAVHGINWLPITGGSLYLGHSPEYCRKNYDALVAENQGTKWDAWADLMIMYRALSDPDDALQQLEAGGVKEYEAGNSRANTYHWVYALREFGLPDPTITADDPLTAVFVKDKKKTYAVFNMTEKKKTVRFSDGKEVVAERRGMTTAQWKTCRLFTILNTDTVLSQLPTSTALLGGRRIQRRRCAAPLRSSVTRSLSPQSP